jgi:hypothetical protein
LQATVSRVKALSLAGLSTRALSSESGAQKAAVAN